MDESISVYIQRFADHRKHGVRYRFGSMLLLVLVGYLCGRDSLAGVMRFAKTLSKPQLKRMGFRDGKLPSHVALCNAFHDADAQALTAHLAMLTHKKSESKSLLHVAIDGKNLRGSKHADHPSMHVVHAFCVGMRTVVGAKAMGKTNEVKAVLALLETLDLTDTVITGDAIFTTRDLCSAIVRQSGHYLLPVKDNQKPLKQGILRVMDKPELKKTAPHRNGRGQPKPYRNAST
jgi:DDE_Tnp_1-associated/Transposase DDE domain